MKISPAQRFIPSSRASYACARDYTADTITFYRGKYDPYWNYVRVTLWVTNDSP